MNKKIAVCIPSYNESENISHITKQIDKALNFFDDKYDSIIVNSDNNSPDLTNEIFLSTMTSHRKESIVLAKKGKGYNITEFFNYCINNDIDYAVTLDADLRSFDHTWLLKMISYLEQGYDFVCPCYERRKEEGNTTNHFVVPILYALYGKFIRQPIGGDYAFNKRYIEGILNTDLDDDIMGYGIDIYMVIFAIYNNYNISVASLGKKIHGVSYYKITNIFSGVLKGLSSAINKFSPNEIVYDDIDYLPYVISNEKWDYLLEVYDKLDFDPRHLDYEKIYEKWLKSLNDYLHKPNLSKEETYDMTKLFMQRVVSFWQYINDNDIKDWEKLIVTSCIDLRRIYESSNNKRI